jgi:hypothetical protein
VEKNRVVACLYHPGLSSDNLLALVVGQSNYGYQIQESGKSSHTGTPAIHTIQQFEFIQCCNVMINSYVVIQS